MKQKRIIITGASGFIGHHLVHEALNRGMEVWAGIRKTSSLDFLDDPRTKFIYLDYSDEKKLAQQLADFEEKNGHIDYVIHNAGITKTYDKSKFYEVNAENTHRFINALAKSCSIEKFMLMSSLSTYGPGDEVNFTPIRLDDPQNPNTEYGKSKLMAEKYVKGQQAFPYVILRPTGVYGPADEDYMQEFKCIQAGYDFAIGKTPQQLTFIYALDLVRVALDAMEKETIRNKEYIVADGDVHTDTEFAALIEKVEQRKKVYHFRIPLLLVYVVCVVSEWLGKLFHKSMTLNTDKYQILKQRNWICDITPLQQDLDFKAQYPLKRGLEEVIEWYWQRSWF